MQSDHPTLEQLQQALSELTQAIRALPHEQQMDGFLLACSALLQAMSANHVTRVRELLHTQFPDLRRDNEIVNLIEGHLALRELTDET